MINKKIEIIPFLMGVFIGLILLSMYLERLKWEISSSLIISICALSFTIWQANQTKKHNILLVKPLLSLGMSSRDKKLIYKIENNFLGPAIINNIEYFTGNTPMSFKDFTIILGKYLIDHGCIEKKTNITFINENSIIAKDAEIIFITSQFGTDTNVNEVIHKLHKTYKIIIKYSCAHGTQHTFDSSKVKLPF